MSRGSRCRSCRSSRSPRRAAGSPGGWKRSGAAPKSLSSTYGDALGPVRGDDVEVRIELNEALAVADRLEGAAAVRVVDPPVPGRGEQVAVSGSIVVPAYPQMPAMLLGPGLRRTRRRRRVEHVDRDKATVGEIAVRVGLVAIARDGHVQPFPYIARPPQATRRRSAGDAHRPSQAPSSPVGMSRA